MGEYEEKQKELEGIALPILQKMGGGAGGMPGGMPDMGGMGGMPDMGGMVGMPGAGGAPPSADPAGGPTIEEIDQVVFVGCFCTEGNEDYSFNLIFNYLLVSSCYI